MKAGVVLRFNGEDDIYKVYKDCVESFTSFCEFTKAFKPGQVNENGLKDYSAKEATRALVNALDKIIIDK